MAEGGAERPSAAEKRGFRYSAEERRGAVSAASRPEARGAKEPWSRRRRREERRASPRGREESARRRERRGG